MSDSEFVHVKPKKLPPRHDLRKIKNTDDFDEKEELKDQKSEDNPEQEGMKRMKTKESTTQSWIHRNFNKLMKVSMTDDTRKFKVGDRVQLRARGPSDSSIQALKATVVEVYEKTSTLKVKSFNGVELFVAFDEVFTKDDVEF